MNPIDETFARLRAAGRKALMPFLVAGDPDLDATARAARALARAGASLLEIGFPYSDPIADGPVIQAAYTRALGRRLKVKDILATTRALARDPALSGVPLVGMLSYSIVHRHGPAAFLAEAADGGLAGAIIPDLPLEEAGALARLAADRDFKVVMLVTPTTPPDRAREIARLSSGFLYCVSTTGITGERDRLPDALAGQLAWLRGQTQLPLCVGFGVSRPEHARALRDHADGVIVGSAFVRRLEPAPGRTPDDAVRAAADLASSLDAALNPA